VRPSSPDQSLTLPELRPTFGRKLLDRERGSARHCGLNLLAHLSLGRSGTPLRGGGVLFHHAASLSGMSQLTACAISTSQGTRSGSGRGMQCSGLIYEVLGQSPRRRPFPSYASAGPAGETWQPPVNLANHANLANERKWQCGSLRRKPIKEGCYNPDIDEDCQLSLSLVVLPASGGDSRRCARTRGPRHGHDRNGGKRTWSRSGTRFPGGVRNLAKLVEPEINHKG
jgi:hypothetical protein